MAFAPRPLQDAFVTAELDDVSTADSCYVVSPTKGKITKLYAVLHDNVSGANATLTASIGGTAITGGTMTVVQSGSTSGDMMSATPTGANNIDEGERLDFATGGSSTSAARCTFTAVIRRS
jgi:hypothetical protein